MTTLHDIVETLRRADQLVEVPGTLPTITGIADDSRRVIPGTLFCAIEGTVQDGHRYLGDARARGASAAIVTRPRDIPLAQIVVRDGRGAAALAAREWFGHPGDHLEIVGVTGTNGKSTTVALTRHLLNAEGTAGSLGTLGAVGAAGETLPEYQTLTTPGAVELQAALAALQGRGVRRVVMEASSHALDQRRLETLVLVAAVFTNLTHEHLDYHETFDAYAAAKAKLSDHLAEGGVEVVNADDPAWSTLPDRSYVRRLRYGWEPDADVRVVDVELDATGSTVTIIFQNVPTPTRLPLLGAFNVSNALAAAATAWALGVEPRTIGERLADVPPVAGRMEPLVDREFLILRDYAHTPDALERILEALRPITRRRLLVLFGAGGDRDRRKRPLMGAIAAASADLAIVTSDNPRTEDPDRIIDDIEAGMGRAEHLRITDRREAIFDAVRLLCSGDCLVLAGKGHETYQVLGTDKVPFDERAIVREALAGRAVA